MSRVTPLPVYGIDPDRVIVLTFILGGALAGVAWGWLGASLAGALVAQRLEELRTRPEHVAPPPRGRGAPGA